MSRNEANVPDLEVVPTAKRQRFTAEEKLRILEETDGCTEPGELGALLRREGIYLSRWRRERDRGQLQALSPRSVGMTVRRMKPDFACLHNSGGKLL